MENSGDDDPFTADGHGIGSPVVGVSGEETDRVDVQEYEGHLTVVADVPVADKENIDTQCNGRVLGIRADAEPRPFAIRVDLPAYVDAGSVDVRLNNGILEITLTRERDPANIGFR
jgi:HSP20 family protein